MPKQKTARKKLVVGLVTPVDWDDKDNITAIAICTAKEEDYIVSNAKVIKKLQPHLHEYVEATGVVSEDEYGEKALEVIEFTVAAENEDDDDTDDDDLDDDDEDEDDEDDDDDDW